MNFNFMLNKMQWRTLAQFVANLIGLATIVVAFAAGLILREVRFKDLRTRHAGDTMTGQAVRTRMMHSIFMLNDISGLGLESEFTYMHL